jgi:molybdate transport system substrate-binding protein
VNAKSLARWLLTLAVVAAPGARAASAGDVHVMISAGFYEAYAALGAAFERASGHRLVTTRGPSMGDSPEAIPTRLARGETADVVILDGGAADELGRKGLLRDGSKVELALSQIGMVVRAGAVKPDIGSVDAVRRTLLAAKSIGYSSGCSGVHAADGFEKLGLTEKLKPKVTVTTGGKGPVTLYLARGDFELGIQQVNIMVGAPGTDFVGPVPAGIDKPCPNGVALLTVSKEQDAARAMIKFMTSPAAVPLLAKVHELPAKS